MPPLLLICDPEYDYSRTFHERLGRREITTRHASTGADCLSQICRFSPAFVLIACETDGGHLAPLLDRIETLPDRAPEIFLIGNASPQTLSDAWGCPVVSCLQRPLDEAAFVRRLDSLSEILTVRPTEREDGVGNGDRPSAAGMAWEKADIAATQPSARGGVDRQFLIWSEGETTFCVSIAHLTQVVFTRSESAAGMVLKLFIVGSGQAVTSLSGQMAANVVRQFPPEFQEALLSQSRTPAEVLS